MLFSLRLGPAALFVFLGLVLSMSVSCGDEPGTKTRQSCDGDGECVGGVCFDSECYSACQGQDECQKTELCVTKETFNGKQSSVCELASAYEGCQLNNDCVDLVTRPCQTKGCDDETGLCYVGDQTENVPCVDAEGLEGLCRAGACVCEPDCEGKDCGGDGCGGFCGESLVGECSGLQFECVDGLCECQSSCEVANGDNKECGSDGCGGLCGPLGGECPGLQDSCEAGYCLCQPACAGSVCGEDGCGGSCGACEVSEACVAGACVCAPDCLGRDCGEDGCGGFCGELDGACPGPQDSCEQGQCECQPICDEDEEDPRDCGADGCGGYCGDLTEGACSGVQDDCLDGYCTCQPSCGGGETPLRDCGADGCGGGCGDFVGECPGVQDICDAGVCTCQPLCTGLDCGPDGCGGVCGELEGDCAGAQDECQGGLCVCVPSCDGKICGSDGCGGDCGQCKGCKACDEGACVDDPCCLVPPQGCCEGQVLRVCFGGEIQQQDCACDNEDGIPCGSSPFCGWNPLPQVYSCATNGAVEPTGAYAKECPACLPDCENADGSFRTCGPDGCGGECGECAAWLSCEEGECSNVCVAACEGRVCGDDGCGGFCGELDGACADALLCTDGGLCVASCEPQCVDELGEAKICGVDGCGGVCGELDGACDQGMNCDDGACVEDCVPTDCGERQCGNDGCDAACGLDPEGLCPDALDCTVDGACGSYCSSCDDASQGLLDPSCETLSFEAGNLFGWAAFGQPEVFQAFGEIAPVDGAYMASLPAGWQSSGARFPGEGEGGDGGEGSSYEDSAITFDLCLPESINWFEMELRVLSEEFREYCGTFAQDQVLVQVRGRMEETVATLLDLRIADLCAEEDCEEGCGAAYKGLEESATALGDAEGEGDAWATPWFKVEGPLLDLVQRNEGQVQLVIVAIDGGDGLFDTRVFADALHFVACDPLCGGRECGPSACGGFCGPMADGSCELIGEEPAEVCTSQGLCCAPVCFPGQECGSNGCEGDCGSCEGAQDVCTEGMCVCEPTCLDAQGGDRVCGSDGCDGVCGPSDDGSCANSGDVCLEDGSCCTPDCEGRDCGDDGCGGFCGPTGDGACDAEGSVCLDTGVCCEPVCGEGWSCGDNACGGTCGSCEGTQDSCVDHHCVCEPFCSEDWECGADGCGSDCLTCPGAQDVCVDHACVCEPACEGRVCGDDGCGDVCGSCGADQDCGEGVCLTCVETEILSCDQVFTVPVTDPVAQEYVWVTGSWTSWGDTELTGAVPLVLSGDQWSVSLGFDDAAELEYKYLVKWTDSDLQWCVLDAEGAFDCIAEAGNMTVTIDCGVDPCGDLCTPDCAGRVCGDDGCGGSCGECAVGETCDTAGLCF